MEITQKTETGSKNEQASEGAKHHGGKSRQEQVSELQAVAVPRAALLRGLRGPMHLVSGVPWFQKDQLCPMNTPCYFQLPPSTTTPPTPT